MIDGGQIILVLGRFFLLTDEVTFAVPRTESKRIKLWDCSIIWTFVFFLVRFFRPMCDAGHHYRDRVFSKVFRSVHPGCVFSNIFLMFASWPCFLGDFTGVCILFSRWFSPCPRFGRVLPGSPESSKKHGQDASIERVFEKTRPRCRLRKTFEKTRSRCKPQQSLRENTVSMESPGRASRKPGQDANPRKPSRKHGQDANARKVSEKTRPRCKH